MFRAYQGMDLGVCFELRQTEIGADSGVTTDWNCLLRICALSLEFEWMRHSSRGEATPFLYVLLFFR